MSSHFAVKQVSRIDQVGSRARRLEPAIERQQDILRLRMSTLLG
jgi:hypothetical protein